MKFLEENRKFKSLSSIPKDSKEYMCLRNHIQIEELLFSSDSTNSKDFCYQQIKSILQNNNSEVNISLLEYLIDLLSYYICIRTIKHKEFPLFIITKLISDYKIYQNFIINTMKNSKYGKLYYYYNYFHGNTPRKREDEKYYYLTENHNGSIDKIIRNDDLDMLKEYIFTRSNGDNEEMFKNEKFVCYYLDYHSEDDDVYKYDYFNLISYCCYYGATNCLKFLKSNGFQFGSYSKEMSILSADYEIIHLIVQEDISYDNCFIYSIKYHRRDISEWLLSNYKCEIFNTRKCIEYYDYLSFIFLLLNGVNTINNSDDFPLGYICTQPHICMEALQLLIDKGSNINQFFKYHGICDTPLGILLNKKVTNDEAVDLLIKNGANVKEDFMPNYCKSFSILVYFCQRKKIDIEMIKYLLKRCINVNNVYEEHTGVFYTALGALCEREDINEEAIKVILGYSPYVDQECIDHDKNKFTPLGFLCRNQTIHADMIKLLIKFGADVNKECYVQSNVCTPLGFYVKTQILILI